MNQQITHYSHDTLKKHALRVAKEQGFGAELVSWGIDVTNHGARLRVVYRMNNLTQIASEAL